MKNIWKVMAAMMVIALPFIVSSCSSDDEDNGPWTLTYFWQLENVNRDVEPAQLAALGEALISIENQMVSAYKTAGFKFGEKNNVFSIEITTNDDLTILRQDSKVGDVFTKLAESAAFQEAVNKLEGEPKMYIWRDGKEIIQHINVKIPVPAQ